MSNDDDLIEYRRKRNIDETPEPAGEVEESHIREPIFVIQKHDATSLHYDFRLEIDGVLRSWAVPKGPSTNPSDKRLAVPTEDHPMSYARFEGVIPECNYGAGPVIVWDTGTYHNIKEKDGVEIPMSRTLENGRIAVYLAGSKLKGNYALTRFRKGKNESWLLIKMEDEYAEPERDITAEEPGSVISGLTVEEMREQGDG